MTPQVPDLRTPVGRAPTPSGGTTPIPGGGPRLGLLEIIWEMISAPIGKK
jgi:hypothetical protein